MPHKITYCKEFVLPTENEILEKLSEHKSEWNYEFVETGIPDDEKYIRPSNEFEDMLSEKMQIYNFAYIKFMITDNDELVGLVGGLSGSRLVNTSGSDISYYKGTEYAPTTKWSAKEYLELQDGKWYKKKVLIVWPKEYNKETDRKIAKDIENYFFTEFNLFGS